MDPKVPSAGSPRAGSPRNGQALIPEPVIMLPYTAKELCRCDEVKDPETETLPLINHVGPMSTQGPSKKEEDGRRQRERKGWGRGVLWRWREGPRTEEWEQQRTATTNKDPTTALPATPEGGQPCQPILGFWSPELQNNQFMLLEATKSPSFVTEQ